MPEGETVVFSAHGVAPTVHANAQARRLNTIDATCPLVTKVHVQARRYAADGYTVVLIGHEGHEEVVGTMGEAPDSMVLVESVEDVAAAHLRARDEARLRHADDALGRRDRRDHHCAARSLPEDLRAEERRHLLRHVQPSMGGEGDAQRDRAAARDRLTELIELEPAGRDGPRCRGRRVPDRRRDRDRRELARRGRGRRRHVGSVCAGEARGARLRLVPAPWGHARSSRTASSTRASSFACRPSCAASSRSQTLRADP